MVVFGVTLEHSQEKETQQDILAGFYFQAAVKQTFEVVFARAE